MPPVSKAEMLSMIDKWQEVEENWARQNDCAMAVVSAETLATVRELIISDFHHQSCVFVLARNGWQDVLIAWKAAQEALWKLAEELYQGITDGQRKILVESVLDAQQELQDATYAIWRRQNVK